MRKNNQILYVCWTHHTALQKVVDRCYPHKSSRNPQTELHPAVEFTGITHDFEVDMREEIRHDFATNKLTLISDRDD